MVKAKSKRGATQKRKKRLALATTGRTNSRAAARSRGGRASSNGRCTGQDIEEFVAQITGFEAGTARELWRQVLGKIRQSLVEGKAVNMTNVGTLEPYDKKPTTYRHPDTGELTTAKARKHVRFIVSVGLKGDLNTKKRKTKKKKSKKKSKRSAKR